MSTLDDILTRLVKNPIFLLNEFEGIAIKLLPGENAGTFAKFKNGSEYQIDNDSTTVNDAMLEGNEMTEEEYEKY